MNLTVPQTDENMSVIWRYMQIRHIVGGTVFAWRIGDDLVVLSSYDGRDHSEDA